MRDTDKSGPNIELLGERWFLMQNQVLLTRKKESNHNCLAELGMESDWILETYAKVDYFH